MKLGVFLIAIGIILLVDGVLRGFNFGFLISLTGIVPGILCLYFGFKRGRGGGRDRLYAQLISKDGNKTIGPFRNGDELREYCDSHKKNDPDWKDIYEIRMVR